MAAEKQAEASFAPEDASGLFDNARAIISKVVVDFFVATKGKNSGTKYVNVDVTFKPQTGAEVVEHYMLGGADQWAPNATKTGAIPLTEGGKVWNKSDVFRFMKSLADAGLKGIGADLSVIVGTDVQVSRVTTDGTYLDQNGKERPRTALLVTKIYELPKAGGAAKGGTKKTAPAASSSAASTAAPAESTDANDEYVTEVLVDILGKGPLDKAKLAQPAFMKITRDKKAPIRVAVQARLQDDAFLATLAEGGVITFDGTTVALAA